MAAQYARLRLQITIDKNGTTVAVSKPRFSLRGTKFSIPMPNGGRVGIKKNMILRVDQLPRKFLHRKTKKKASKPVKDVFLNHHSDKKAPFQPPVRKAMAIFSQKRNPNDNHHSRSMH
ncbi:RNA-binding NOB1-like protein [Cardamine amara subsp. amara]|uniref:RNA-binding NOB1-like protein n=1 Tax=Cardamine amara subsp. amara TaxID=228776 RepID=A0ABD1A164_CARAN